MLQPGGRWRAFNRRALFPDKGIFSSRRNGHRDWLVRLCDLGASAAGWLAERMDGAGCGKTLNLLAACKTNKIGGSFAASMCGGSNDHY